MSKHKKSSKKNSHRLQSTTSIPLASKLGVSSGIAIIMIVALLAFLPSLRGGFIMDDDTLLTKNFLITAPDGLYRFWCTAEASDYWPVTNTTLWIEWRLWGMNPTGYHVTNLILHIVESLLIWLTLRKMCIPGAFLAAIIFAMHPVNVESVAWISSRKNLLAMLFFLMSILCYLKVQIPSLIRQDRPYRVHMSPTLRPVSLLYWLSLAAFVLAMLSKGSAAVLPILLLGIIWWLRPWKWWDLLQSAPFFLVAVLLSAVNVWFQTHGTEIVTRTASFTDRLLGAGGVVWFYLCKSILPIDLAFVYPQWHIEAGNLLWWLPLSAALIFTMVLWWYRNIWSRSFLFAWGFFCVALVPVMGFTDVGFMKYSLVADHYQHIAIIGVIALASALWSAYYQHAKNESHQVALVLAVVAVGVLAFLTWRQNGLYSDAITLYQDTLEKNPNCWMAQNNLGSILLDSGQPQEAIDHYRQALSLKSDYPEAHYNLGLALEQTGRSEEAIEQFDLALRSKPDDINAHNHLGIALAKTGRSEKAIEQFQLALRINPEFHEAHFNVGNVFRSLGQYQQAIDHYQQGLQREPNDKDAHINLGIALFQTGRFQDATIHFKQALQLKPDFIDAYTNLALTYARMRQSSEALAAGQKALELAQSQGQTESAKKIENWLKSYRLNQSGQKN
jgi:protein O-mannosyl-transferase